MNKQRQADSNKLQMCILLLSATTKKIVQNNILKKHYKQIKIKSLKNVQISAGSQAKINWVMSNREK